MRAVRSKSPKPAVISESSACFTRSQNATRLDAIGLDEILSLTTDPVCLAVAVNVS